MKILAICGSPRGPKSQTRALAEALLAGAVEHGASTGLIDLGGMHMAFCRACETCHRGPACVLHDDLTALLGQMLEADGIVLASPIYLDHVTAQMKAMLDRTSHFIHCLRLEGKYLAAVTTSGGGSAEATAAFLRRYAITTGAQFAGAVHASIPLREANLTAARRLGAALVEAIDGRRSWPDQVAAIAAQRKRFGRIISLHKAQWPYEHAHWEKRGWA